MRADNIRSHPFIEPAHGSAPSPRPDLEEEASYAKADNPNTSRSQDEETGHRYPQDPGKGNQPL